MRRAPTIRILFISGMVTIAVFFSYYAFFTQIRKINREASLLANEREVIEQGDVERRNLSKVSDRTKSDSDRLETVFITKNDIVDFLKTVEGLGETTGAYVSVRSISEEEGAPGGISSKLALSISSSGTWEEVYHFFTLL